MVNVRSVRRGLAAIPIVVVSQCAPECAVPGPPPPATSPPTATSPPPSPTITIPTIPTIPTTTADTTPVAAPVVAELGHVAPDEWRAINITRDGRYVFMANDVSGQARLDLTTGTLVPVWMTGIPTDDGGTVIWLDEDDEIVATNVLTGASVVYDPIVELGFVIEEITGVSGDGNTIGVWANSNAWTETGVLLFDAVTGTYLRADAPLLGDEISINNASWDLLVSADGATSVFSYFDEGTTGCRPCTAVWARTDAGLTLVSATPAGTGSETASSYAMDVSADGRYVLFYSEATDLGGGGPGSADGRFYVRDILTASTVQLPVEPARDFRRVGSISDDGQRVSFSLGRDYVVEGFVFEEPVPAVYDLASGATIVLIDEPGLSLYGDPLEISGDGRRVVFTMQSVDEAHRVYWADLSA